MLKKQLAILLLLLFVFPGISQAEFDMSLAVGYRTIDFGRMELGEEKTLAAKGGYEHQFNFTSDNNRRWYFKAQLVRPFTSGAHVIAPEDFHWIVDQVRVGQGTVSNRISTPRAFSKTPALIYTSSGADNTGTQVQIRLKYKLDIPEEQAAGAYTAHIRFVMVEAL